MSDLYSAFIKSLPLGASIEYSKHFQRKRTMISEFRVRGVWEPVDCVPTKGILVGFRTLVNGVYESTYDDYGFTPESRLSAALVAFDKRRAIVRLPLESVVPLVANMAVRVFFSEADEGYIATFYGNSFISGFGDTPMEAFEQLQVAAEIMN